MKLAQNRAFFFPTGEVYEAAAGFYEWGPFGQAIRKNVINTWRKHFLTPWINIHEMKGRLILPFEVLKASGHVDKFVDPQVTCKNCQTVFRADHLIEDQTGAFVEGLNPKELTEIIHNQNITCPNCNHKEWSDVEVINTMFPVSIGVGPTKKTAFLRPETAQNIFIAFPRIKRGILAKIPFGIAQIGSSFRNEISPRQGLFRLREFEQMEIEYFVHRKEDCDPFERTFCQDCHECMMNNFPLFDEIKNTQVNLLTVELQKKKTDLPYITTTCDAAIKEGKIPNQIIAYFLAKETEFLIKCGIPFEDIRFREMLDEERPFYSASNFDLEIKFSFGWKEAIGNAYRTNYDLSNHGKKSKKPKNFQINYNNKSIIPHVVEPSFGVERLIYAILEKAYQETNDRTYPWLKLKPYIAPYSCAIFPLRKDFADKAKEIYNELVTALIFPNILYDESGGIGKRYARADEIGVPFQITIDYSTFENNTVTIRYRDTKEQIILPTTKLPPLLNQLITEKISFEEAKHLEFVQIKK